jgi:GNAT superfamily N-acetyltransferase
VGYELSAYQARDEPAVLELLAASLGPGPTGRRSPELFRWKHFRNPFGPSLMLVAREGDRVIGLRAFMRWEFRVEGRAVRAVRAVDTATHPEHQGRGVFSRLTRAAVDALRGEVDLIFNTPNERSGPGYLKLGWRPVGRVPVGVRVRRPLRFAAGLPSLRGVGDPGGKAAPPVDAPPAADALDRAGPLLEEVTPDPRRFTTPRNLDYLRWRYGEAPFDYRAVSVERGGRPAGLAVFRLRSRGSLWEASVTDVLVPPGDRGLARSLLRRVARSGTVDHLTCSFPPGSDARLAAGGVGFLPAPWGPRLVVNPLVPGWDPDPTDMSSWGLSLGDVEIF